MANCTSKQKVSNASTSVSIPVYTNSKINFEAELIESIFSVYSCPISNSVIIDRRKQTKENNPFTLHDIKTTFSNEKGSRWRPIKFQEDPKHNKGNIKHWFYGNKQGQLQKYLGCLYCRGRHSEFLVEGYFLENQVLIGEKYLKIFGNGMVYYGTLNEEADLHGKGELIYSKEERYAGEFQMGLPHGKGNHFTKQGKFSGIFKKGEKHYGILEQDGGTYEGKFINNLKEGQGIYTTQNGVKYKGTFKKNRKNGMGELYDHKGEFMFKALWKNDKLQTKIE